MKSNKVIACIIGIVFAVFLVASCGNDDDSAVECSEGQMLLDGACVADIPEGWTKIEPGGDTLCSRGTPFRYFVRKGTVNKVIVGFDGGGACWDALTCSVADAIFSPEADEDASGLIMGFFNFDHPDNPFGDWYQIFIPYCTGDIHWGNNTKTYPPMGENPAITIEHKGFVNASAALEWLYKYFNKPEVIFVTGVSAGAYGSLLHAVYVMDHYPDSQVVQLGDCGAGVITGSFIESGFVNWDVIPNVPESLTYIHETPLAELSLSDAYIQGAEIYTDHIFAQYNTAFDDNQIFYYTAMGGDAEDWSPQMFESIEHIAESVPNFRYWIQGGEVHGILPRPELYTYAVDGMALTDWILDLVAGEDVPNVKCTGTECEEPELLE